MSENCEIDSVHHIEHHLQKPRPYYYQNSLPKFRVQLRPRGDTCDFITCVGGRVFQCVRVVFDSVSE